jgi:hypothetical protein
VGQRYWDGERWTSRYGVVRRRRMVPLPRVPAAAGVGMAVLALAGVLTASLAGYAAQNPGLLVTSSPASVTAVTTTATGAASAPVRIETPTSATATSAPDSASRKAAPTPSATHPPSPAATTSSSAGTTPRGRGWLRREGLQGTQQPLWSLPSPACTVMGVVTGRGELLYFLPGQRGYRPLGSNRSGVRPFCSEQEARKAGFRQG